MRPFTSTAIATSALLAVALAPSRGATGPQEEVEAVLRTWAEAYAARDGERSAAFYTPDARVWGTASRSQAVGRQGISDYFVVTARGLRSRAVEFGEFATRLYGDAAVSSGQYTFRRVREDGTPADTPARFSMTLVRQPDGRWLIADHHSSPLPEAR